MKQLFIVKASEPYADNGGVEIAGSWAIDTLDEGAIAFFNEGGTLVDKTDPEPASDRIFIGLGTNAAPDVSVLIPRTAKFEYLAYAAPVAAVKFLGCDDTVGSAHLPASIAVGDVVGVDIIDLTKPTWQLNRVKRYSYNVASGQVLTGKVAGNVIYDLITLINADANAIVTAALVDDGTHATGISFTAKTAGNDFGIGVVPGVLGNADVVTELAINGEYTATATTPTPTSPGFGTYAQIAQLEKDVMSWRGNGNYPKDNDLLWTRTSKAVLGTTYSVFTIRFNQTHDGGLIVENNPEVIIYIAVPSGESTLITNITTILTHFTKSLDTYATDDHTHA